MFSQNDQQKREIETVIGPSVSVEGNFEGNGNILVQGNVNGSIRSNGIIKISQGAKVKAEIKGSDILVAGEIRGNITAKGKVELAASSKVYGNIETQNLMIEAGAFFQGKSIMSKEHTEERLRTPIKPKMQ